MLISSLSGIIPGAGDVADIVLNYYLVVRKARQAEYVLVFRSQNQLTHRYNITADSQAGLSAECWSTIVSLQLSALSRS